MEEPIISGPSFLGLNKPGPARNWEPKGADHGDQYGQDLRERYSSNLNYLLEDDDEPKRGLGKIVAFLVALVLLGGFGYLRWKQGGFDWLMHDLPALHSWESNTPKPDPGIAPATTPSASASPESQKSPGTEAEAQNRSVAPATPEPPTPAPVASLSTTVGNSAAPASNSTPPPLPAGTSVSPTPDVNSSQDPDTNREKGPDSIAPSPSPATTEVEDSESAPPAKPQRNIRKVREPKPTPVTPVDPTAEAERYVYGQGVTQDCDRGLRLLKPAAVHSNARAMESLGALYSSGTCAPRDLPTAYRWFALALRQEPENQRVQSDLQDLWSKMTQPERQLAIKLSQ
jgi:hypothetical protein